MLRMDKITTGAAYGASAGSVLNGILNAYSPEQWNASLPEALSGPFYLQRLCAAPRP